MNHINPSVTRTLQLMAVVSFTMVAAGTIDRINVKSANYVEIKKSIEGLKDTAEVLVNNHKEVIDEIKKVPEISDRTLLTGHCDDVYRQLGNILVKLKEIIVKPESVEVSELKTMVNDMKPSFDNMGQCHTSIKEICQVV